MAPAEHSAEFILLYRF